MSVVGEAVEDGVLTVSLPLRVGLRVGVPVLRTKADAKIGYGKIPIRAPPRPPTAGQSWGGPQMGAELPVGHRDVDRCQAQASAGRQVPSFGIAPGSSGEPCPIQGRLNGYPDDR